MITAMIIGRKLIVALVLDSLAKDFVACSTQGFGQAQFGQAVARSEYSFPHSEQIINAIVISPFLSEYKNILAQERLKVQQILPYIMDMWQIQ
jgi:hypothetical protein